jgi:hypothetical protein
VSLDDGKDISAYQASSTVNGSASTPIENASDDDEP